MDDTPSASFDTTPSPEVKMDDTEDNIIVEGLLCSYYDFCAQS